MATGAVSGGEGRTRSPKLSEQLAERLRGEIATGTYQPGDMLPPESVMMERYRVSRPSMREAMRVLESEGLLRIVRGAKGGAEVLELDVVGLARRSGLYLQLRGADLADLRAARAFIDPGAIALAAERRDPAALAALRECIERARTCRSGQAFGDIAADFVEQLLGASGNETLSLFALVIDRLLRQEFHRFLDEGSTWTSGEAAAVAAAEWSVIVDRIEEGDAQAAIALWAEQRAKWTPPEVALIEGSAHLALYPESGAPPPS